MHFQSGRSFTILSRGIHLEESVMPITNTYGIGIGVPLFPGDTNPDMDTQIHPN